MKVKSHLTTARLYGRFCCCSICQAADHGHSIPACSRRKRLWSKGKGLQLRKELKNILQPKDEASSKLRARKTHPGEAEIKETALPSSCNKQPLVINFVSSTLPATANPPRKRLRCHTTAKTWRYGALCAPGPCCWAKLQAGEPRRGRNYKSRQGFSLTQGRIDFLLLSMTFQAWHHRPHCCFALREG